MSSHMMGPQPSPALPHTLPFISSPKSTNTTSSTSAPRPPPTCNPTSNGPRQHGSYYHSPSTSHQDQHHQQHQQHQAHQKHHSDNLHEPLSDPDPQHPDSTRPVLETEGVVSSEVGAVPGILHQDLHPDGQPRRPMNAFMIFARHRRPAIQAKEPGLKTGEISKRLSHDWKNLPDEDKSHYLEQAKLLKDEFHNRFPEYVYKRRPNNTGKRRSSASQQQLQPKFSCSPGGPPMITTSAPGGPGSMSGLTHPADIHHHPHHHATHADMYSAPQPPHHLHSLPHHPPSHHHHPGASQPPRPPSSMTHPSPKMNGFYPPANPSSPRYHQIGLPSQPLANCSQSGRPSAASHYGHSSGAPTANGANPHSRPPSPPGHHGNGMPSYMRLPQPLSQQHPSQYPWFANDQYGGGHQHHAVSTPVAGGRHPFYYPSWPSGGGENGSLQPDDHASNHNRAASYSGGAAPYRPTSPLSAERARQLSLPSHTLTPNETSYIKSESGYTSAVIKTENPSGSPYASAATPSASTTAKPESQRHQQQLGSAPSSAYPNYPPNPPTESRSYSSSSTSPVGPSFAGPRGLFSAGPPISENPSNGTFVDPHQSPLLTESHSASGPPPQSQQASSVAY